MRAVVDPENPLSVLTTRELLANRALARRRKRASGLVARIDTELERRRAAKGARLFAAVPPISALDSQSGFE